MFQDSKSGQTHFENDVCGEPEHNKPEKWEEEFVEKGADIEHNRWSNWQKHLHSRCIPQEDGSLLIPADLVQRWERQIATNYSDLSESEKESDRKEARTYIPLVRHAISEAVKEERKKSEDIGYEIALETLRAHIQKQIYQPAIYTESLMRYLDEAIEERKK